MSYTKGKFKDGHTGWKTNDLGSIPRNSGFGRLEVIWSQSQECVCDNVYEEDDAKLIAHAPTMLEGIKDILSEVNTAWTIDASWLIKELKKLTEYK